MDETDTALVPASYLGLYEIYYEDEETTLAMLTRIAGVLEELRTVLGETQDIRAGGQGCCLYSTPPFGTMDL